MRKVLLLLIATLTQVAPAYAGPAIDFSTAGLSNPGPSSTTFMDVVVNAFVYTTPSGTPTYTDSHLWQRNDGASEHGFGVCSEGTTSCNTGGDVNELSNQLNTEVIRLTAPSGKDWSNIWVSSLDTGGSGSNETGTVYWSNSPTPNLSTLATFKTFSHTSSGFGSSAEGSIFSLLPGSAASADFLFFRAGPNIYGTNNDYLVWGVNVMNAVPEPEIYATMSVGLLLMGLVARRKREQQPRATA